MHKILLLLIFLAAAACRQSVDDMIVEIPTDQEEGEGGDGEEEEEESPSYTIVIIDGQFQDMSCDWEGGTLAFEFWINEEWQLIAVEPADEWITFEQSSGEAGVVITTITTAPNPAFEPREGKVKINDITTTTITQSACDDQLLDLDKEML